MSEKEVVNGIVLYVSPIHDFDKRVVLLTKERGKITCFARGARRQNSALLAAANPFAFGEFTVFPGKESYTLVSASIQNYFRELATNQDASIYGFYFLEFASYFTRENLDATEELKLLYLALKALLLEQFDNRLVRRIFEMRMLVINGEYPILENTSHYLESTKYAFKYIEQSSIQRLFSFKVNEDVLKEMEDVLDNFIHSHIDKKFNSLELLI